MQELSSTRRSTVRRSPHRAVYDRATLHAILDDGIVCHLGFVADGQPYVIPTSYGRDGETLYLHGSSASRALRVIDAGVPACVTITLIDGLVLSRAVFTHSINYRSVIILGQAVAIVDDNEKLDALRILTEHIVPGRWKDVRPPNRKEMRATSVLRMGLDEASVKVRNGPPVDEDEDLDRDTWAGVLPFHTQYLTPVPDPRLLTDVALPQYVSDYRRPGVMNVEN